MKDFVQKKHQEKQLNMAKLAIVARDSALQLPPLSPRSTGSSLRTTIRRFPRCGLLAVRM